MRLLLREVGYVSNYLIVFTSGMYFAFSTEIKFRQCAGGPGGIHLPIYKKKYRVLGEQTCRITIVHRRKRDCQIEY